MEQVSRAVVITLAQHPCAMYLAAQLAKLQIDVRVLSQVAPKYSPSSWRYLRRLLKNRGATVFADNLALSIVERARFTRARLRTSRKVESDPLRTALPVFDIAASIPFVQENCVFQVRDASSRESCDIIRRFHPDLLILAGAPILSRRLLELARYGAINPHCGITPDYAGSSPIVWPLYDDRPFDIGYTIHFAVPQVDAGPVIEQNRLPWRTEWSTSTLSCFLLQVMYERLALVMEQWIHTGMRPTARAQRPTKSRPPAGYYVFRMAERRKARLIQEGVRVVIPPDWQGDFRTRTDLQTIAFDGVATALNA